MRKHFVLWAVAVIFSSPNLCHGQTESTKPGYSKPEGKSGREPIFGFVLGVTTLKDLFAKQGVTDAPSKTYAALELLRNGKVFSVESGELGPRIKALDLTRDGENLLAIFLDDVLFELIVIQSSYQDEFDDVKFISNLRAKFNQKYKRLSVVNKTERTDYLTWFYRYEYWSTADRSTNIVIRERKKITHSEYACLDLVRVLSGIGMATARMEYDCKKASDNVPRYLVGYSDTELKSVAFNLMASDENERSKAERKMEKERLNKF